MKRPYYSSRGNKAPLSKEVDLDILKKQFLVIYNFFEEKGYLQESFGYRCVDAGYVLGELGSDVAGFVYASLKKESLWPIEESIANYTEEDLFDIIEFVHDQVSKPTDGTYHGFGNCGWHYSDFDRVAGRIDYREKVNHILQNYQEGYEVSGDGEILINPNNGLQELFQEELDSSVDEQIRSRVDRAVLKFRKYGASVEDQKDAIRELADVLEFLRPEVKKVLRKDDESDLFNLANNFGIRHHNQNQKTDYDNTIWYPWVFQYYLATIHALLRLIEKLQ